MKKVGLTLGKFAPLHKGHEFVLDTMLREMDEVIVIIYDTEVISIPLSVRAGWIRTRYPQVTVIEAWDGPVGYSTDPVYKRLEENYVLNLLNGQEITAFYSSEFYGAHMSRALHCEDKRVDAARLTVPISATKIRQHPFAYREYLSDTVYRDLIIKVVFLGAMSTGKSTLTEVLATRYHTTFAKEYGRYYWTDHQEDRRIGFEDFDAIAKGHLEWEEEAFLKADKYCFIDTNAITTYMYSLDYHGRAPAFLTQTALANSSRYDLFFLCEDDIPYDDTWDRSGNQKREVFHKQIKADLACRRIPYISLYGTLEQRIQTVDKVLAKYKPYENFYGHLI